MADGFMNIAPYLLKGGYTQPSRLNKFDNNFFGYLDRQFVFFLHVGSPVRGLKKYLSSWRLGGNNSSTFFWSPAEQKKAINMIQRGSW